MRAGLVDRSDVISRLRRFCAASTALAFCLSGACAETLVVNSKRARFGDADAPEWEWFQNDPPQAASAEFRFDAKPNQTEATLFIRQADVKFEWRVVLNGRAIGKLSPMPEGLVSVLPKEEILDLIGELYRVERDADEVPDGEEPLEYRRRLRDKRSRPVVEKIWVWANSQWGSPESELRKAIKYMQKIWPELTLFLDDPRILLDNNPAEQSLRGPVLGRKNHYGSRSKRGLEVAAALYSLIETAQLCGVNPADYL